MLSVICKVLSLVAGVTLLFFSARLIWGQPQVPDMLWAAAFFLFAMSFGLNLLKLRKACGIVLAGFHTIGVIYLVGLIRNMTIVARGESGSKEGLWQFFLPPVFMMVAFLVSIVHNLARLKRTLRRG